MRMRFFTVAAVVSLLATAACSDSMTTLAPATAVTTTSLISTSLRTGTYASTLSALPQNSCGAFAWTITSITATSVAGTFSTICNGSVQMTGTGSAQATLGSNGTINWTGTATASVPGNASCAVALTGTVEITSTGLTIPYSGTTCLGAVSGTQILAATK